MATVHITTTETQDRTFSQSGHRRAWRRLSRNRFALASLWFLVAIALIGLLAPLVAPFGPEEPHYDALLEQPFGSRYFLGTDELGRDILSRIIFGVRTALFIAIGAELLALVLGVAIGLVAGYKEGRIDQCLMAITDILFAYPSYLLTVILVTVAGRQAWVLLVAIGISSWVGMARLVRAQVLTLKHREFVEAGQAMGANGLTISLRYILPNAVGPLLVSISYGIPAAMVTVAGLSLLGLGVQPPTPSLGGMIQTGLTWILSEPHLLLAPATIFACIMLAFTWLGDGLRDAFDVRE